jgi:hypothetical protein
MNGIALDYGSVTDAREWLAEEQGDREARRHLGHAFEEIIGTSAALTAVLRQVELVATTDAIVLLQGETGPAKSSSPTPSINTVPAATTPSSKSTAPPFRRGSWRASSLAMSAGPSRGPSNADSGALSWRTRARSFSMRSATCRWTCSPSCCGCYRSRSSSA